MNQLRENVSKLPDICYSTLPASGEVIIIKLGETGYYRTTNCDDLKRDAARSWVDMMNEKMGVTKAQERAMLAGSMFGWEVPGADPDEEINKREA